MIELNPPLYVLRFMYMLEKQGFEAFLVGGCVRDHIMGIEPGDYDIATSATPDEIKRVFSACKTALMGEQFGTVKVIASDGGAEITSYRAEGRYSDSRRPDEVRFGVKLEEDLARRDFTINAMAWNEGQGLVDPFGGARDIEDKIIRCVGDAKERFLEDPLRMLRAVRFSGRLKFTIESGTSEAMEQLKENLTLVSKERIRDELLGILMADEPFLGLETLFSRMGRWVIPELYAAAGFMQNNPHHAYDVLTHTLHAVSLAPKDEVIRLTLLLHDVAKPLVYSEDGGGTGHFYGHDEMGARMAGDILRRLHFDNKTVDKVCLLIKNHSMMLPTTIKGARRMLSRLGHDAFTLLEVMRCDNGAKGVKATKKDERLSICRRLLEKVIEEGDCVDLGALAVGGNDMQALGLEGREIGRTLARLLEAVLARPELNNKDSLMKLAADIAGKGCKN